LLVIEFGKQIQRLMMQEIVEQGERGTGSGGEGKGVKKNVRRMREGAEG